MKPEEALLVALERCVNASALLAAARLPADADDKAVGRTLAAGVVCGWADHTSAGAADANGITVRDRGSSLTVRVRWSAVAAVLRPALREPGVAERLADIYGRYAQAACDATVAGRLSARATAAELAQARRQVIDHCRAAVPVQQSLFPPTSTRGRDLVW
jgi:hypothetical protein